LQPSGIGFECRARLRCFRQWMALSLLSSRYRFRSPTKALRPTRLLARSRRSQRRGCGSIPQWGTTMSRPADPAAGLRSQLAKVRLLLGTLLLSLVDRAPRLRSVAMPFDSARERCECRVPVTHQPHKLGDRRFNSVPRFGDNARCDAALIRPAAVVRVHVSPLWDRLLARIARL
jgi:hypothetical protein